MKYILAVFTTAIMTAGVASAQTPPASGNTSAASPSMKLSASECTGLWQKATSNTAKDLTETQAKPYVTDFKAANTNGDMTIDQSEWMAACNKGLISNTASTGASSGTSGSAASDRAKEHPPTNRMDDAVPDMKPPKK